MTLLYTSNDATIGFDATVVGAVPTNWVAITGSWTVQTTNAVNGHANALACTSAQDGQVALATGVTAVADMDFYFCQKSVSNGALLGAIVRADNDFYNGYLMVAFGGAGGSWYIFKRVSGNFAMLASGSISLDDLHPIAVRMQVLGAAIRFRMWNLTSPEPSAWTGSVTDGSVTAAGYAGFYCCEASGATNGTVVSADDIAVSSLAAVSVTVDTPASLSQGASYTLTGTYAGAAPTGINYTYDGIGTAAATGLTASGGTWTATAIAPATVGPHWLSVQEANATTATAATASFSTIASTATVFLATPGTVVAGSAMTISGTYTGTPPTGLNVQFDAAGYAAALGPTVAAGAYSFTVTAPAAGSHTVTVQEANATTVTATSGRFTSTVAPTISVATPGSVTAGAAMTVSGTYTGKPPAGLNVQFDAAGYTAAPSPMIAAGAYSFTVTAPAAGSHTVTVQEANATTVAATSASFTSTSAPTVEVATPATANAGASMIVSGTYAGPAPTGLNYCFDGAAYGAAGSPMIGGGTYSFTATAPTAGTHTVSVQEANNTTVAATSGSFTVAPVGSPVVIAPNSPAIVYSPYNWAITETAASSINAGAYFSTLFTGTGCTLTFNLANNFLPLSEIWWRIDGPEGVWTEVSVAASIACALPAATSGNADIPYHLLEVVVKSTTETQNRWNAPSGTAVVFTGLLLASGATALAPVTAPRRILAFGDSITEGVRTVGEAAANDTDRNDAMAGWAFRLGALLGAEVGVVGFGAQGILASGSGNVPSFPNSYAWLSQDVSRSFAMAPDLIVINLGTNDGGNNTVSAMIAALNGLIAACPGTPIAVLRPFDGTAQAANLQAAIAGCANPLACHYIDTTGALNTALGADSLGLHPSGPNNLGRVAPLVAAALKPLLGGSASPLFRGGFQRALLG